MGKFIIGHLENGGLVQSYTQEIFTNLTKAQDEQVHAHAAGCTKEKIYTLHQQRDGAFTDYDDN